MEKKIYSNGSIQILENSYSVVPAKELYDKIQKYCNRKLENFTTFYLTSDEPGYKRYKTTGNKTSYTAA